MAVKLGWGVRPKQITIAWALFPPHKDHDDRLISKRNVIWRLVGINIHHTLLINNQLAFTRPSLVRFWTCSGAVSNLITVSWQETESQAPFIWASLEHTEPISGMHDPYSAHSARLERKHYAEDSINGFVPQVNYPFQLQHF